MGLMRRVLLPIALLLASCVPMPDVEPKARKNDDPPPRTDATPATSFSPLSPQTRPPTSPPPGLSCAAGYQPTPEWGCVISEELAAKDHAGEPFRAGQAEADKLDLRQPRRGTPYKGAVIEVLRVYAVDVKAAEEESGAWKHLAEGPSKPWSAVARCRQAEAYDALARKLEQANPPQVELFSRQELAVIDKLEKGGSPGMVQQSTELKTRREEGWHRRQLDEVGGLRQHAVSLLAPCVLLGVKERFAPPAIRAGAARLAELEETMPPGAFGGQVDPLTQRLTGRPWQAGLFSRAKQAVEELR
jgi:hypothetical protein